MALKLGEMLLKAGMITDAQLEEGLKAQVIFGGKLGTNLIELGLIEEEDLAKILSEKLALPYVRPEHLMAISPDVIQLIPKGIAQRYKVIPLALDRNRLSLIMADPSDLAAIDEIAFITGFIIKPFITPEVRLVLALEKYYGVPRDFRYIKVIDRLRARAAEQPKEPEAVNLGGDLPDVEEHREWEVEVKINEILEEDARIDAFQHFNLGNFADSLAEAGDRDQIGDIVIKYVSQTFDRVALFIMMGQAASGWKAMKDKKFLKDFSSFQMELNDLSILKEVVADKAPFVGFVPGTPANKKMLDSLGGPTSDQSVLIPLMIRDRVVNILYADGGGDPRSRLSDLQRIVSKAAMAFEILILKNKIRMS